MKTKHFAPDDASSLAAPAASLFKVCGPDHALIGYYPETGGEAPPYLYISACFCIEAKYPYRFSLPADISPEEKASSYCLIYTENGQGSIAFHQKAQEPITPQSVLLPQQTYFFWPCSQSFSIRAVSSHWKHFFLFIYGREAGYFYQLFQEKGSHPWSVPSNSRFPALLSNLARKDAAAFASPLQQLFLTTSLMTEALSLCQEDAAREAFCPDYLLAIRRMLDEEYALPCSLDLLEKRFRVSKYRIAREFSQHFHQAPISYLNQRRLEAAKNLLVTTEDKIHEISQKTGFGNPNLFIRSFKKEFGVTPQVYRKENSKIRL